MAKEQRRTFNPFTDHGYVPGTPAKPTKYPKRYQRGGFGTDTGTIPGLGEPTPHVFNGCLKKTAK